MREHRVPLLGDAWRRHPDPERSGDPRVQAVVHGLRSLQESAVVPAPDATFRAELRAQLVAITPRIIAEGGEDTVVVARPRPTARVAAAAGVAVGAGGGTPRTPSAGRHTDARRLLPRFGSGGAISVTRIATSVVCSVVAILLLLAGAVVMSRHAVPGDTLYGLKRANERFELSLDSSDTERASDLLRFASTRADEARVLAGRAQAAAAGPGALAGGLSSETQSQIRATLASADQDVLSASRLLAGTAVQDASQNPLKTMTEWAPTQLTKLHELSSAVQGTALSAHVAQSANLVSAADTRAKALSPKVGCACLQNTSSDSLGPKPCTVCTPSAPAPAAPGTVTVPSQAVLTPANPTGPGVAPNPAVVVPAPPFTGGATAPPAQPAPTPAKSTPIVILPGVTLPPPPLSVSTCGVQVSLGGLKVTINVCKTP